MDGNEYTFDSFIVGESNASAFAAAKTLAEAPGKRPGPLFLWGGPGLGKTHLLRAIGEYVRRNDPAQRVRLTTGTELIRLIVEAARDNRSVDWAEEFRSVDVLLIDDVQELIGKTATQAVFAAAVRAAAEGGRPVALASPVPPETTPVLTDRLQAAHEGFVIAGILPPEPALCRAFAVQRAAGNGLRLSEAALDHIAGHAGNDLRRIAGVIHRLRAERALMGRDLSEEDVVRIVDAFRP